MTNREKIRIIAEKLMARGGNVWFPVGGFCMAQEYRYMSKRDLMWVYEITPEDVRFRKDADSPVWEMPLDWFNEAFLSGLYVAYKSACKAQLNPRYFKEVIMEAVGEE